MSRSHKRRKAILNRLAGHFLEDLRCATVTPSKASWVAFDLDAPYRFGWMPPVPVGEDASALVVSFCPELLAETTMWLSEEQLDTYLTVVEAFVDALVAYVGEPAGEVYNRIQDQLYEQSPDALALVSEVEGRALDAGIVRPGA